MAITSSAKKAIRVAARKRVFNLRRKDAVANAVKKISRLVKEKKIKEAQALLPMAYKAIDKAVKTKFFKKNTAARKKSRLAKFINKSMK
ncbi:MAG: 30S ribosomal protein S20 [Candidatus Paceibacterota bacterium]|jgi:small subunit ribosomal protein S20